MRRGGGRGSRPGRYFTTADTSKRELQSRTLQALQREGYAVCGEVTVLSGRRRLLLPDLCPFKKSAIINYCARYRSGRRIGTALAEFRREFADRHDAWSKSSRCNGQSEGPSSGSGSGRHSQRRSSGALQVQAAETSPSIEDRVDVRTDTPVAQVGLTPELI